MQDNAWCKKDRKGVGGGNAWKFWPYLILHFKTSALHATLQNRVLLKMSACYSTKWLPYVSLHGVMLYYHFVQVSKSKNAIIYLHFESLWQVLPSVFVCKQMWIEIPINPHILNPSTFSILFRSILHCVEILFSNKPRIAWRTIL